MKSTQEEANEIFSAYKEAKVAHLLIKLTEAGGELKPKYDTIKGYTYPEIELLLNKTSADTDKFLQKLATLGILEQKFADMAIYCPSCSKANISTNYTCPFCNSPQIIRNALIEHIPCGYIDNLSRFRVENDLFCPRCKKTIKKEEIRSAGRWYECASCKKRVENVQTAHACRECGEKFDFNDAKYIEAYNYSISENSKNEINRGELFSFLAEKLLTDLNYEVQVPGKITGLSGIQQEFEIVVTMNDGKRLAIDPLFSNEPVDKLQIIREYGKITDAQAQTYIIAASFSEDARKLIKIYKLNIIEANPTAALKELEKLLSGKAPKKMTQKQNKETEKKPAGRGGFFKKNKPTSAP